MKNIIKSIICTVGIITGVFAYGAIPAYQVYDLKFNAYTTAAKGVTTIDSCCTTSDDYVYREKSKTVIRGVLAGCHCGAILANGSCVNAILYLWDETHKIAITNVETETGWRIQVIGKKQNVVEHFMRFKATYGENDEYGFDITMSGFGSNRRNTSDPESSYATAINGNFAGLANAPYYFKAGKCNACSAEPDIYTQTVALPMCGCSTYEGETNPELTPFYGAYGIQYNSSKSKKVSANGITQKSFGLPSYVGVLDFVATNIGE